MGEAIIAWPTGDYTNDTLARYRVTLGDNIGPWVVFVALDPSTGTLLPSVAFSLEAVATGSKALSVAFSLEDEEAASVAAADLGGKTASHPSDEAAAVPQPRVAPVRAPSLSGARGEWPLSLPPGPGARGGWRSSLPAGSARVVVVDGPVTLVPPILTLVAILATRSVVVSLFVGIYFSALVICNFNPAAALLHVFNTELVNSLADAGHANVILFTWALSGMVACILKLGGGKGLVRSLSRFATTPRTGALVTIALGSLIFFDGLASSLIIGPTMRPITDGLYMSRERLVRRKPSYFLNKTCQ